MLLLSAICLFAPFPLLIVEQLLPFPFLIEEIFRYFVVKNTPEKNNWLYPIVFGILFSLSETMLYLVNFFKLGNFENLFLRIILTTSLHTGLFVLMYFFRSRKALSILFLVNAIIIHYLYNFQVGFRMGV